MKTRSSSWWCTPRRRAAHGGRCQDGRKEGRTNGRANDRADILQSVHVVRRSGAERYGAGVCLLTVAARHSWSPAPANAPLSISAPPGTS